ncbi:MAG: hypothetical protein LBU42_09780 [Prevotellaceae bacterium]|jgi:uncharacterized protein (TIGR02145 family)|nr:hypothetical protein [Prevotellaceae bacterium]
MKHLSKQTSPQSPKGGTGLMRLTKNFPFGGFRRLLGGVRRLVLLLLFGIGGSPASFAQATVTPISANYDRQEVTFRVAWNAATAANNRVWVWVDFCSVAGTMTGAFAPATVSPVSVTNGSYDGENGRGLYIYGNPTTVTVALSGATSQFNWCAYGSDYPPNVTLDAGSYTFKGTTDFIVSNPAQTVTTTTISKASLTLTAQSTFTDATGCPGIGSLYCPYTGSDLYMDATHLCQQRTGGAQNWEAWIKDTRDNELYRIVLIPDDNWWTAEEIRYDASATQQSYKCPTGGMRTIYNKPADHACPANWILPSFAEWSNLHTIATNVQLSNANTVCGVGENWFGISLEPFADRTDIANNEYPTTCLPGYDNQWGRYHARQEEAIHIGCNENGWMSAWQAHHHYAWNQVRCIRHL